jgi:hypothetical protein
MITIDLLKSWHPCVEGFKRFCELYPNGADLYTAAHGLKDDGHPDWGLWLYDRARQNKLFEDVTKDGFANTGDRNTGDRNTGDQILYAKSPGESKEVQFEKVSKKLIACVFERGGCPVGFLQMQTIRKKREWLFCGSDIAELSASELRAIADKMDSLNNTK